MRVKVHQYLRRRSRPREPPLARAIYDPEVSSSAQDPSSDVALAGRKEIPVIVRSRPSGADSFESDDGLGLGLVEEGGKGKIIPGRSIREAAASTLDDLLGFNVVPPTYLREYTIEGTPQIASVQTYVKGIRGMEGYGLGEENKNDLIKIVLLDFVLGNVDRHSGNVIITDKGRVKAIDNESILGVMRKWGGYGGSQNYAYDRIPWSRTNISIPVPLKIQKALKNLVYEDFVTALAGNPKEEVEQAWKRKLEVETWKVIPGEDKFNEKWNEMGAGGIRWWKRERGEQT